MNQPRPWDENPPKSYELSGKIMLSAIVIIFVVVVFMVILHVYARWYLIRLRRSDIHRRRSRRNSPGQILVYVDPNNPVATAQTTSALDASVLRALPVFAYTSKTHPGALECPVCLSEFEEGEKGRVLPKCEHSFHLDCIDMWFQSHSTCPICRSPVEPQDPANPTKAVVSEPGSSSGFCSTWEDGQSNTTSLSDRRKGFDLVGVRIEVPRRGEFVGESGPRVSSPASQGFKSPPSRLMSLKRIMSMGRKTPSSGVDENTSSSSGGNVELAKNELTQGQGQGQTQTPEHKPS